jgi:hypothetical protein
MAATQIYVPVARSEGGKRRRLLRCWAVVSVLWLAVVGFGFCARVNEQIDATREIGRELQMMDCESSGQANCATTAAGLADYEGSWSDTAALFATYGFWILLAIAVMPPCGVLLVGSVLARLARGRQRSGLSRY